jgi:hypothetical protein
MITISMTLVMDKLTTTDIPIVHLCNETLTNFGRFYILDDWNLDEKSLSQ